MTAECSIDYAREFSLPVVVPPLPPGGFARLSTDNLVETIIDNAAAGNSFAAINVAALEILSQVHCLDGQERLPDACLTRSTKNGTSTAGTLLKVEDRVGSSFRIARRLEPSDD